MADQSAISPYLEGLAYTSLLADWAQTRKIARNPTRYSEKNKILGKEPSQEKVDAWMGLNLPLHKVIREELPNEKLRNAFDIATLLVEAKMVHKNKEIGLGINKGSLALGALLTGLLVNNQKKNKRNASIDIGTIGDSDAVGPKLTVKW